MMDEFDDEAFQEIKDLMGDNFKTLVVTYMTNAETYIKHIKLGFASHDCKTVQDAAHSLKSSSRYLGLAKLGDKSEELEMLTRQAMEDGNPDCSSYKELCDEISRLYDSAADSLQNEL
ncbi:MAG: Hpt domain-containing protein [Micavibrio sp.]|nr:Hpt domain-containing protein [Micavibrio sp.]